MRVFLRIFGASQKARDSSGCGASKSASTWYARNCVQRVLE